MRYSSRILVFGLVAFGAVVGPASAQTPIRGIVAGFGGATFGTETNSTFGANFGANVSENIQIFGEGGYMRSVTPKDVRDALRATSNAIRALTGDDISIEVRSPTFYGLGGVRFLIPTQSLVRPYIQGAVGFANVDLKAKLFFEDEDVTSEAVGLGFVDPDDISASTTEWLYGLGGGVIVPIGSRLSIDLGYKFHRIGGDGGVNVNNLTAGFGVTF